MVTDDNKQRLVSQDYLVSLGGTTDCTGVAARYSIGSGHGAADMVGALCPNPACTSDFLFLPASDSARKRKLVSFPVRFLAHAIGCLYFRLLGHVGVLEREPYLRAIAENLAVVNLQI